MKKFLVAFLICFSESDPPPAPAPPDLKLILKDCYWQEVSYLYAEFEDEKAFDGLSLYDKYNKGIIGGDLAWDHALHIFKVDSEGIVRKYRIYRGEMGRMHSYYTDSAYLFRFDPERRFVRLEAMKPLFDGGWFAGQSLETVSATDSKLVFDCPIRDNIREFFENHPGGSEWSDAYTGIRTTWTRIDDPDNAEKWGTDLTEVMPDWMQNH